LNDQAKEAVLTAISARSTEPFSDGEVYYPAIDTVQIIHEGTPVDSPACKFLVDMYTQSVTGAFVVEKSEAIPKDFLHDLALSLLVNRPLMKDYERRAQDLSRLGKQNESMRQELASLRQAQRAQNVQSSSFSPVRSHHQSIYNSIRPRHGLRMIDRTWLVTRIFSW
jgi:hypothetical protein